MFEHEFSQDIVDERIIPEKYITLTALSVKVNSDQISELFTEINLNPASPNYIESVMKNSNLVNIKVTPVTELTDPSKNFLEDFIGRVVLSGGDDGTMDQVNSAVFIGEDKGTGKRTGIQAFLEIDAVRQ